MRSPDKNRDTSGGGWLASILRAAPLGIGLVTDRVLVEGNEHLFHMLGLERSELVGRKSRSLYDSQREYDRVGELYQEALREGFATTETQWRRKDGRMVDILLSIAPVVAGSLIGGITFTALDITQRKQAEERVRQNEIRLDTLLALAQMKERPEKEILDYALEKALVLTDSRIGYLAFLSDNETVLTMYSWTQSAMAECRISDKPLDYVVAETGLWGEAVRQRRPVITNDYAAENPWKKGYPQGHIEIQRHMNLPLIDGGRIVLVAGVGNKLQPYEESDVKQLTLLMEGVWGMLKRLRGEQALRESERRFAALYAAMTEAVALHEVLYDSAGQAVDYHVIDCNPAYTAVTGIARDRAVGALASEVYGTGQPPYLETFARVARTQEPEEMDVFFTPMGKHFHVSIFSPAPGRFATVTTDVTERKRAEEERRALDAQVQHAQKLESLGVLAGGIAHDFNNLLTAILGNADLALAAMSPEAPGRDCLEEISRVSRRAAELCRQMLAYSGKGRFHVEPVDLSRLVEEMSRMLEVAISKKAVLKYRFAPDLPAVEADATQIRQVVMNLIVNASEAIGDRSGVIAISTGLMDCDREYLAGTYVSEDLKEGPYVFLEVADTGCGMSRQTLARVFEPFFSTKFAGRGLGLAAVLGIVRGHRGAIKVYSEPGRGTTFKVLLPACVDEATPTQNHHDDQAWQGRGLVLVVDDEETIRAMVRRMLEHMGLEVLAACDGREAVDLYRRNADRIGCVLLDLTMPHMDGEETFRELHRIRRDVRVILSSGYSEQDVSQRFAGKGLAGFVHKPYRLDVLRKIMKDLLEKAGDRGS